MIVYRYKNDTYEYIGPYQAQIDPIAGGYLMPANATDKQVPTLAEHEVAVYNITANDWNILPDYRGCMQVELSTLQFSVIRDFGPLPEGFQYVPDDQYAKYQQDPDAFAVVDGVFIDISNTPEYVQIKLDKAKTAKKQENDCKRDEVLLGGVTYKDVLFDSDTDQKINLLDTVAILPEGETIVWFGMNNVPLECTRDDLLAIGDLIRTLTTFCWTRNAEIKAEIEAATTIEEVNTIVIDYSIE